MDLSILKSYWRLIAALLIPTLLLPLCLAFETDVNAGRCAYVVIIMGCFWVFELLPIPITGLIPAILFPLLGVQKAEEVAPNYFQDSVMLFIGGIMVALAVEHTNLHKRVALGVLLLVGVKPYWIMAGFMLISAGLSMFISNTATTAMILPIALAVVMELNRHRQSVELDHMPGNTHIDVKLNPDNKFLEAEKAYGLNPDSSVANIADVREKTEKMHVSTAVDFKSLSPRQQQIAKALVLSVAYASGVGGMATLTGTTTNLVFIGSLAELYPDNNGAVTYASFSMFAVPTMVICLILAFCCLTFQFFIWPYLQTRVSESDPEMERQLSKMFRRNFDDLGPMKFAEGSALGIFITLVLLWFFRAPGFIPGWDTGFRLHYVSDATPAIFIAFLLFLWPSQLPSFSAPGEKVKRYEPILTWKVVSNKFPWDVVLLMGGALALAEGVQVSGLTDVIKIQMESLRSIPQAAVCIIVALIVTFCTEFASNAAIASIFLPVVADLAEVSHIHPLYYMLAVTLSCSFAFMMPVATPSNAIIFSSGILKVIDMVKAGLLLKFICIAIMIGSLHTFGYWVFDLQQYPSWASVNSTVSLSSACPITA